MKWKYYMFFKMAKFNSIRLADVAYDLCLIHGDMNLK
ncbi:hypothetical protein BH11BAC4_BH11BAC4_08780 [soil metagenome]